jgi:hypothetical protein
LGNFFSSITNLGNFLKNEIKLEKIEQIKTTKRGDFSLKITNLGGKNKKATNLGRKTS